MTTQQMETITLQHVRVGVGVLIVKNYKVLLGLRRNSHSENTWAPPGGHVEWFETPTQCAKRETFEETGLQLTNIQRGPWCNTIFNTENKHYLSIFMLGTAQGEPILKEPNKCFGWQWFPIDTLPAPLFMPVTNTLKEYPNLLLNMHNTLYNECHDSDLDPFSWTTC